MSYQKYNSREDRNLDLVIILGLISSIAYFIYKSKIDSIINTLERVFHSVQQLNFSVVLTYFLSIVSYIFYHPINDLCIILIILLGRHDFTIYRGNSVLKFRPLFLTWKTTVAVKINQINRIDVKLITYLENNRSIRITYKISINQIDSSIIISLEKSEYFIPIMPSLLMKTLLGLLLLWDIHAEPTDFTRDKNLKYFKISFDKRLFELDKIIEILLPLQIYDLRFLIKAGCKRIIKKEKLEKKFLKDKKSKNYNSRDFQNFNNFKQYLEFMNEFNQWDKKNSSYTLTNDEKSEFKIEMEIGINKQYKDKIPLFEPVLQGFTRDIKFGKRRTKVFTAVEALKILQLPELARLKSYNHNLANAPPNNFTPEKIIGKVLTNRIEIAPFGISVDDFRKGGIICGAIGNGKTTLRLHILKHLLDNNVRIIDFDIKGDAPKFGNIGENGVVLIPGVNFSINPFLCPSNFSKKEYADILTRTLIEIMPDSENLTAPQKHLLTQAIHLTVKTDSNALSFFTNIYILAYREKSIVDNLQETSAQALIVKLSWMQNLMADIFWKDDSSLKESDYSSKSLFFDLSSLITSVPILLVRFLINLIMTRVVINHRGEGSYESLTKPNLIVTIDEAQLLMPRHKRDELTRLEEIVTTLRYKGISVIAAGVSAEIMSPVLLDTGFLAQYRSESKELLRGLGLDREQMDLVPKLEPYTCILNTASSGGKPIHVKIDKFGYKQQEQVKYLESVKSQFIQEVNTLGEFKFNQEFNLRVKITSLINQIVEMDYETQKLLTNYAKQFVQWIQSDLITLFDKYKLDGIAGLLDRLSKQWKDENGLLFLDNFYPDYLFFILREFFVTICLSNDSKNNLKINSIKKNLDKFISFLIAKILI